jgi:hypothetical protein
MRKFVELLIRLKTDKVNVLLCRRVENCYVGKYDDERGTTKTINRMPISKGKRGKLNCVSMNFME